MQFFQLVNSIEISATATDHVNFDQLICNEIVQLTKNAGLSSRSHIIPEHYLGSRLCQSINYMSGNSQNNVAVLISCVADHLARLQWLDSQALPGNENGEIDEYRRSHLSRISSMLQIDFAERSEEDSASSSGGKYVS